MPNPINVPITPPRVAFLDPRSGTISREWYLFFLSLFQLTSGSNVSLDDLQKGPLAPGVSELQADLDTVRQELQTLPYPATPLEYHEVLAWLSPE